MDAITVTNPHHIFVRSSQTYFKHRHWLFPIEDRRDQNGIGLPRMLHNISLSGYLQLIDWSSRRIRPGKINVSANVPDILTRLRNDADSWQATLEELITTTK